MAPMADPLTIAIATAVAGKATESLTDQARQAVAVIARRIRQKFHGRPEKLATLEAARDGHTKISELAMLLEEACRQDPQFGIQIRSLWNQTGLSMTEEGVVNIFHGQADKVIQLRDVHGDLNIN